MSDINFDCPKCGQNLDAPADLGGLFIECPACNAIIKVPPVSAAPGTGETARPERRNELKPPPAPPAEDKGATMRIEVPPDALPPPPPPRRVVIRRGRH